MNDTSHIGLLIQGEDMAATGGVVFERCNPISGDVVTRAAAATLADVEKAADAAQSAWRGWAAIPPNGRRAILLKAADLLEARRDAFIAAMRRETGATASWAGFNVMLGASMLREAAAMTTQISGETLPSGKPDTLSMSVRQPVGVVLGIAPWNAPVILGVRAVAIPLACGNAVILKSSEICPETHRLIGQVLHEAGVPAGVINIISSAPQDAGTIVNALIAHRAVRRINFTGSTRVGRLIAEAAARELKPVLLELGGKAPLVILEDADLEGAVNAAAFGAFLNQGQICMSTERIIIAQSIADRFSEMFAAKAAALPMGEPDRTDIVLGPMVDCGAAARIMDLVEDAKAKGARVLAGGTSNGPFVPATVLDHVTPTMRIYAEESFGPVACIIRAKDEEDAIRLANDSEYGLSASVFSRDISRALTIARQIDSGICHINGPTVADEAQAPFGGVKSSGYGRFGGKAAINEFTELRWITIEPAGQHYPF